MNFIDVKYVNMLSNRLERFTVKSTHPYRVNCRCPICGDSQKSKSKARGWILEKDNSALYYCHNCGASMGLRKFLNQVDPVLYNDYIVDTKLANIKDTPLDNIKIRSGTVLPLDTLTSKVPEFRKSSSPLSQIRKISQLKVTHGARKYVENRLIPAPQHYKLYYAPKFNAWVNTIIPDKLPLEYDAPRLVLPFISNGKMFGFQGRSFDNDSLRYITIMLDESSPKIFGLEDVDFNKKYYVVEGPIDSLFVPNSIAMAGADGNSSGLRSEENGVFVFDNEPRNVDIVNRMDKLLSEGKKVCIWPSWVVSKDINDLVLSGITPSQVQGMIDSNTYEGLEGRLALAIWRRCK